MVIRKIAVETAKTMAISKLTPKGMIDAAEYTATMAAQRQIQYLVFPLEDFMSFPFWQRVEDNMSFVSGNEPKT